MISQAGQLYPGIMEVLARLRASGHQMAICSNGTRAYVERVVEAHELGQFFDVIRYRASGDDGKPGMVHELLGRMAARPGIVIGDRADDVEAAHQNGLAAIASAYGYGAAEELESADRIARSPGDLWRLIGSLLKPDGTR